MSSYIGYVPQNYGWLAAVPLIVTQESSELLSPTVVWATPQAVKAGTTLSGTQLNAAADVAGTFTYIPPSGTVMTTVGEVTLTAMFVPADTSTYSITSSSVILVVQPSSATTEIDGMTAQQIIDSILNTPLTEEYTYPAHDAQPTLKQALYMLLQIATEKIVDPTTRVMTVNKLDGTTPAMTFQLDSATAPKTITRIS